MAEQDTLKSSDYGHRYRIVFGPKITAPQQSVTPIDIVQSKELTLEDSARRIAFKLALHGIKINKRIYQPNEIEAELDFMKADSNGAVTLPDFDDVSGLFAERMVTVSIQMIAAGTGEKVGETTIASAYYVHELNSHVATDTNGTRKMYVKLHIFSMDKRMTLNKYSKAYVARKLGSGILQIEAKNFGMLDEGNKQPLISTNIKGLRFLRYNQETTIKILGKGNISAKIPSEFIHPYLVQYNESFYDFLVRSANRYGEFLYFEDGNLNLGLAQSGDTVEIKDYQSLTTQECADEPFNVDFYRRDPMKDMVDDSKVDLNMTYVDKRADGFPKDAFPDNNKFQYNAEAVNDEYLFPLFKDKFTDFARERKFDKPTHQDVLAHLMPTIVNFLGSELTTWYVGLIVSAVQAGIVEEGVKAATTLFVLGMTGGRNADKNLKHIDAFDKLNEQSNGNKVVQFGGLDPKSWVTLDYYNTIKKHQHEQQLKMICIDMGVSYAPVKLGQKIKVDGLKQTYVVVQIVQKSEQAWGRDYDRYGEDSKDKSEGQRSQKIYAIPAYEEDNEEKFIPPVQPVDIIRRTGPQAAFVTDNDDPKNQGRVRVMYPWQTSSELISLKKVSENVANRLKEAIAAENEAKQRKMDTIAAIAQLQEQLYTFKEFLKLSPAERKAKLESMQTVLDEKEKAANEKEKELMELKSQEAELAAIAEPTEEQKGQLIIIRTKIDSKESELIKARDRRDKTASELALYQEAHDHKLDEEDQSKDKADYNDDENPVVKRLAESFYQKKQELVERNEACQKAEVEKTAAETNNEKMKEVMDNVYKTLSSPWVRVSTPMATFHGGTYFKPRIGDEVLVDYDNGNIERPYVTGSLYSKNVLDPQELIERRYSPESQWSNVSMAMVSPNGHHITFTDPPGGLGFVTNAITPGLGLYGSLMGVNASVGESFKDLNGGIHIGDRYGVYEIEMLTHKRRIGIRSPFGTVDIDAFTGISINAPNGDVTIRGKNIKLEAGNKITINSGKNLPEPDYGDSPCGKTTAANIGKAIVEGVAGAVTDMFASSVIDLSLVRNVIEVYVRPVDGTTLIKSRKFLKLEAGLGKATVKRKEYKKTTFNALNGSEEFYKLLINHVMTISSAVDTFFGNYYVKYMTAHHTKSAYFLAGDNILDNPILPNLYEKAHADLTNLPERLKVDDFKDFFLESGIDKDKKKVEGKENMFKAIETEANNFMDTVWDLFRYMRVDTLKELIELKEDAVPDEFKFVAKASKSVLEAGKDTDWLLEQFSKWDERNHDGPTDFLITKEPTPTDLFNKSNRLYFKRILILFFLYRVFKEQEEENKTSLNPKMYIHITYDPKDLTNEKNVPLRQAYWWKRQVDVIDRISQNSLLRSLYESTIQKLIDRWKANYEGLKDKQVWDANYDGQILFSDKEDSTLSFEGEGVHRETDANQGTLEHLKWILRDIK